jgi:ABC-type proline/glycine betaine transport system permease subunit
MYVSKQEHTATLLQNYGKFIFTFSISYYTSKENFSEIKNSRMHFNLYAYKPFIFNCFYVFICLMSIRVIKSKTVVFYLTLTLSNVVNVVAAWEETMYTLVL